MKQFTRYIGITGLSNFGVVYPGDICRGAQPDSDGYGTLKLMTTKAVLSLRTHSERELVEAAGLKSIEYPLEAFEYIHRDQFETILNILRNPDNLPLFVHCRQGHDRTGVICAAYRVKVQGWTLEEAEEEMQAYGFNDLWIPLKKSLREFVEK
jgi:tyrosine-protein phosphatase SIW14